MILHSLLLLSPFCFGTDNHWQTIDAVESTLGLYNFLYIYHPPSLPLQLKKWQKNFITTANTGPNLGKEL